LHLSHSRIAHAIDRLNDFVGSLPCAVLHAVWFILWFVFHLDTSLLTNIVSLEAIFLTIFVLMSQNRQAQRDRKRDDMEADEITSMYENHDFLVQMNQQQLEILNQQTSILELLSKPKKAVKQ